MFYLIPEEFQDEADLNASPANLIYYESNNEFIFKPNHEMLYGLTLCTKLRPILESEELPEYLMREDIFKDYDTQVIEYPCDNVMLDGVVTSYAKEKLSDILRIDINDIYPNEEINSSNITLMLKHLNSLEDRVDVYQEVLEHSLRVITIEGATVPSLSELIKTDTNKYHEVLQPLIEKAKTDPTYKFKVEEAYSNLIKEEVESLDTELVKRVQDSNRIKMSQVMDIVAPQMIVTGSGDYYLATNSLSRGLTEKDLRYHAVNNRSLLAMKQNEVPKGGYLSRQLIFAGQGVQMDRLNKSTSSEGILIPRNKAQGRTLVSTREVLGSSDSEELVEVVSFVTSENNDITPDMVSESHNEFQHGSNIGIKFTSSATGDITQAGLSLKHGGALLYIDPHCVLKAPFDCTVVKVSPDKVELRSTTSSKVIYHLVPSAFLLLDNNKDHYSKGEVYGFLNKMIGPDYKSEMMIDLLGGLNTDDISGSREKEYSFNVSPTSGKVTYEYDWVIIGNRRVPRDPRRVYYFHEGDYIKAGDIICNGVLDCVLAKEYTNNIQEYYNCFRVQYLELMPGTLEHVVEYLFSTCHVKTEDGQTWVGIKEKVRQDKSWFTNLGYEGAGRLIENTLAKSTTVDENNDLFNQFFFNIIESIDE